MNKPLGKRACRKVTKSGAALDEEHLLYHFECAYDIPSGCNFRLLLLPESSSFAGVSDIVDYLDSRRHFVQMIQQLAMFSRGQLSGNDERVPGHLHLHFVRKRKVR